MAPCRAKKFSASAAADAENAGSRNSETSSAGCVVRRCQAMNATSRPTPASSGPQHPGRRPAHALAAADDAEHQRTQPGDGQQHAGDVQPARRRVAGLRHQGHAAQGAHRGHREAQQEHRAPPVVLEHQAAGQRSAGDADAGRPGPDADRPAALAGREHVGDDGEGRRLHRRAAHAHQRTPGDELLGRAGERGQHRAQGEDAQPDEQRPAPADAVTDDAPAEQQPGEHQDVGVDGPLQLALGGREVALQRGQGDVEHRVAHDHHEQADDHGGEHPPASPVPRGSCLGHPRSTKSAKASRLRSDSPRLTRHAHSRRMDVPNPISSIVLKWSSA